MPDPLVPSPHASALAPPPAPKLPAEHRAFGDVPTTRKWIFEDVLDAASKMQPISNDRHTLKLSNVRYVDPDHVPRAVHKQATLAGETVGRRLKGTWELTDNATGRVLDTRDQVVARVPYLTSLGTFIHRGTHYTVNNQLRLKPGVYARIKNNGALESHLNALPGHGVSHRYLLDPAKEIFKIRVGQAEMPLMPLLQAMGVTDAETIAAWGPDLHAANMKVNDSGVVRKLKERFLRPKDLTGDVSAERQALIKRFADMQLDPEVTRRTLGHAYAGADKDTILAATSKLLALHRGEGQPDDRDGLPYQRFLGPEDLFRERIERDHDGLRRQAFWKASNTGNLSRMPAGLMTKQLDQLIVGSGLAQAIEEINPLEVFDKQTRVTRLGEGGISSTDSIPDESRGVSPTHYGFIDPIRTPESFHAGIDLHMARGARKDREGNLRAVFRNPRTRQDELLAPQDVAEKNLAFPGWHTRPGKRAWALKGGGFVPVRKRDVDYALPDFEAAFSSLGNMIPGKSAAQPQRISMGSRYLTQALPLLGAEAPLVRGAIPGGKTSFEEEYGKAAGAVRAEKPGSVEDVTDDTITLRHDDGTKDTIELYNNYPFARKTVMHQTPTVQPGQRFLPGQLLARSNYTDDKGVAALGVNARTAYLPWKGYNYEDAIVVSESMARDRLRSEHLYQHELEVTDKHKLGMKNFRGMYPAKFTRESLAKLDDDGVIRPGTTVEFGEPLVVALHERAAAENKIHKQGQAGYADASITWKHHDPGIVTDVVRGKNGPVVAVKSYASANIGDKLSGRYGDKGVLAAIVPDAQMPHDHEGKPFEVLVNPLGVISRANPIQMHELWLGKIAAATGKPVAIPDFQDINDLTEWTHAQLKQHGLSDTEDLVDPETRRKIPGVATGNRFFMKLHHTSESKGQGRGTGGYTSEGAPAKGGETGSKRISMLDVNALLSHGAVHTLRDAGAIRGQRNEDYWLQFMQGYTPRDPHVPLVYEKFLHTLQAAGINVHRQGNRTHVMALTGNDVSRLSGGRSLANAETVRFDKELQPVTGGLFDPALVGGHHGQRWSQLDLEEPMLNPVMEEPARRLLGLTREKLAGVISGQHELPGGGTGPQALAKALKSVDVDREIDLARGAIRSGRKTARDLAIRKLGYLKSAKALGIHPGDWVWDAAPVLPPAFRPVNVMGDSGVPLVADANMLYKELFEANANLKAMKGELGDQHVGAERLAVYHALKAVTGLGEPITVKSQQKKLKGLLKQVLGSSPKFGTVQRKLLSSTVDNVGRAVVAPNPDFDLDTLGLPETKAFDVYGKFLVRRMRRKGMPVGEAMRQVRDRTPLARDMLDQEMESRPVYMNRAPVLHKYGIMAFRPQLVSGDVIQTSPLIVKGFGMDFDGDTAQFHVPTTDDAVKEAYDRMLPSRNLLAVSDFQSPMYAPGQDYAGGLYAATQPPSSGRAVRTFATIEDLKRAYARGDVGIDEPARVLQPS